MNKIIYQKIYKGHVVDQMRQYLRLGETLPTYFKFNYSTKDDELLQSTIVVEGKTPVLKAPKNPVVADLDNAIALHEYYKNLDETQASDSRLWVYLSHVQFRKYTLARWGLEGEYKNLKDDTAKYKAINQLLEHWFVSSNDRDLRRHSIARLWWAAHLTYAPWKKDPEFFGDLEKKDPYHYTKVLLYTQDIYQQVLERGMGRSPRILISVLDFLEKNKKFADSRENIRSLLKELNLIYGVKKIITLDRSSLSSLVEGIANEIIRDK